MYVLKTIMYYKFTWDDQNKLKLNIYIMHILSLVKNVYTSIQCIYAYILHKYVRILHTFIGMINILAHILRTRSIIYLIYL